MNGLSSFVHGSKEQPLACLKHAGGSYFKAI
jgi:hypothetical protein